MEFVPGSHLHALPWVKTQQPDAVLGNEIQKQDMASPLLGNEDVYLNAMHAGYISLHADLLIHGSQPNHSNRRRCGFTLRYCASDCVPAGLPSYTGAAPKRGSVRGYGGQAIRCSGDPGICECSTLLLRYYCLLKPRAPMALKRNDHPQTNVRPWQ